MTHTLSGLVFNKLLVSVGSFVGVAIFDRGLGSESDLFVLNNLPVGAGILVGMDGFGSIFLGLGLFMMQNFLPTLKLVFPKLMMNSDFQTEKHRYP